MEKSPNEIPSFTIPALMALSRPNVSPAPLFSRDLIARCRSSLESFRFPCRIDGIIISICTAGECTTAVNLRECRFTAGSMFICGPKTILQAYSTEDFCADVLIVSPQLLGQTHINLKNMMPLFLEMSDHPCLPLSEADMQALHNLIGQLENECRVPTETSFTPEVVGSLISAAIYKICDITTRYFAQHPESENAQRNRAEEYFRHFMRLLGENYTQERSVNFYARQMCITPKYLTTLIKRVSGKSVSEWIDNYVVLEAKTLLKYSNMSIQEIAYYLNFPNQSFFGSYFKRNTGMSPSQYKLQ